MTTRLVVAGQGLTAAWAALEAVHAGASTTWVTALPLRVHTSVEPGLVVPRDDAAWRAAVDAHAPGAPRDVLDAYGARASAVVDLLDRMGVPWSRTVEGLPHRASHLGLEGVLAEAGVHTALLMHKALAQQVLAAVQAGKLTVLEEHALLSVVPGEGQGTAPRGVVCVDAVERAPRFVPGRVVLAADDLNDLSRLHGVPWNAAAALHLQLEGAHAMTCGAWLPAWRALMAVPGHAVVAGAVTARAAVAEAMALPVLESDAPPTEDMATARQALEALALTRGPEHPWPLLAETGALWQADPSEETWQRHRDLDERWQRVDGVDHAHAPRNPWPVRIHLMRLLHRAVGLRVAAFAPPPAPAPADLAPPTESTP